MSVSSARLKVRPVSKRRWLGGGKWKIELGFPLILVVAFLIANILSEKGGFGLTQQFGLAAPLVIAAMASTPAIMSGGLDLSISPLIYFTNAAYVMWFAPHGLGGVVAIPLSLALGAAVGALTGLFIVLLRVDAIVVTLAMYFGLQGIDLIVAPNPTTAHLGWLAHLAGSVGPIPGGLITILATLGIWWALRATPFLGYLKAAGSNAETAFSSGINVNAVRVLGYALGGLFAGVAGLALTAVVQSTTASQATEYTLPAIAAVTLGGISLAGGRGILVGAALGGIAVYLLQNLLESLQVNPAYLQLVYGAVLIVAVVVGGIVSGEKGDGASVMPRLGRKRIHAVGLGQVPAGISLDSGIAREEDVLARRVTPWQRAVGLQKRVPVIQCALVIAIFLYGCASLDGFGTWTTVRLILVVAALVGLASIGQTVLILMGGFDLSVSGFIVAGAVATSALVGKYHLTFGIALLLAVLVASTLGALAGWICHRFRIQPLIATLAMGSIALGAVQVPVPTLSGTPPTWISSIAEPASKTFGTGAPPLVVIWVTVAIVLAFVLHRTVAGRRLMATGGNRRAAEYALISTRRIWMVAFGASAALSVLVGILIAGYGGGAAAGMGDPYLFQSVVAVVVGGTIFGGPGDYTRTCVGALLMTVLTTVLVAHGATTATQDVIYGAVILAAIAVYGRRGRLAAQI